MQTYTLQSLLSLPPDFPLEADKLTLTDNTKSIHYIPRTPQELMAIHQVLPEKFITVIGCAIFREYAQCTQYMYPVDWYDSIPENFQIITAKEERAPFIKKQVRNLKNTHLPVGFNRYYCDFWEVNEFKEFQATIDMNKIIDDAAKRAVDEADHIDYDKIRDDDMLIYNYTANISVHKKILSLLRAIIRNKFTSFLNDKDKAQDSLEDIYFPLKMAECKDEVFQAKIEVKFISLVYFAYLLSNSINDLFLLNDYPPFGVNEKKELEYLVKVFANCRLIK